MNDTPSGELTTIDRTPPVITTADEYRQSLSRWQGKQFHILTPFSSISGLAASHGILTSVVQLNPEREAKDIYDGVPWLKKDEVALAKNGLRRIAEGLGISTRLDYISVAAIRHYWHVKAIATYRGIDGSVVTREASMEWDLRDGSDRLKGWTAAQISEARKHGLRACETRAINAAIRECGCGIKQAYRREEIMRPFVAVRVMYQPDMKDPETRRIMTEHSMRGTSALYAGTPSTVPHGGDAGDDDDAPRAPRHVGSGSTPGSSRLEEPSASTLPEGTVLIVKIEVKDIPRKPPKTGTFPKWIVIDSNGAQHVTINRDFSEALQRCLDHKRPVEIVSDLNGYQENEISEVIPAGDRRQGGLLDASDL